MTASTIAHIDADVIKSPRGTGRIIMSGSMGAREVAAQIAARIARGEWLPGDKLPTSGEFAIEYDVNERTVDTAMGRLIDLKLVRGKRGHGRYVA